MKLFPLLLISLLCSVNLQAQEPGDGKTTAAEAKPELPSGPLLQPPGQFAEWEITYAYTKPPWMKEDPGAKEQVEIDKARIQKIVTTKTGQITHETRTDFANKATEAWYDGRAKYIRVDPGQRWAQITGATSSPMGGEASFDAPPASGFRDMDTVSAANYVGTIPYGNDSCLVFAPGGFDKLDLRNPATREKKIADTPVIVFINADSRLPIAMRHGMELRSYRYNTPPAQMQSLPVDLSVQLRKAQEARARLEQLPPRPF